MGELRPPFAKGQSYNPGGRPKGISLTKLLSQFLELPADDLISSAASGMHPQYPKRKLSGREMSSIRWAVALIGNDARAREQALDRMEGSVAQVLRHELAQRPDMTPAEIIAAMSRDQARPRGIAGPGPETPSEIPPDAPDPGGAPL